MVTVYYSFSQSKLNWLIDLGGLKRAETFDETPECRNSVPSLKKTGGFLYREIISCGVRLCIQSYIYYL